jgi:plastocyanin
VQGNLAREWQVVSVIKRNWLHTERPAMAKWAMAAMRMMAGAVCGLAWLSFVGEATAAQALPAAPGTGASQAAQAKHMGVAQGAAAASAIQGTNASGGGPAAAGAMVERGHATYQIVTNEIAAKQPDGRVIEVYRFDPSVYVVNQGDEVELRIRGLKGRDHPVVLEGYGLRGVVRKNQVLTLRLRAERAGIFRLVCTSHADAEHEGPMEGYLVVVPKTHGHAKTPLRE